LNEIIQVQGKALDEMNLSTAPDQTFTFNGMLTDIGVSNTGILGLAAFRAASTIELRWAEKKVAHLPEKIDIEVSSPLDGSGIEQLTETTTQLVENSGKVQLRESLRNEIRAALTHVHQRLSSITISQLNGWKLSSARLDLNFTADGKPTFITTAGAALRIRIEWQIKPRPAKSFASTNEETKLIMKILSDLNQASMGEFIPGFNIHKIHFGFGSSIKKPFGLSKYSTGFIGFLTFVPHLNPPTFLNVPAQIQEQEVEIHGFEEEVKHDKIRLPWRRNYAVKVNFLDGLKQSFATNSAFISKLSAFEFKDWYISNIRLTHDVSKTGVFGLSTVTSRGIIEIENKRFLP
jgi:hypothetical protein